MNNNYNDNDLIIKELTDKIILQNKHITTIKHDFIRMNENINYQFEKYKNTINEKIKLNNKIIDNFTKDINYFISICDNNNNNNNNNNIDKKLLIIKKEFDDTNINTNINFDKKLLIIKKEFDDYTYNIDYQLIKLKHDLNDKIDEFKLNMDNIIKKNNRNNLINIYCGLLFQFFIIIILNLYSYL